jgi:allophanate hydrolase
MDIAALLQAYRNKATSPVEVVKQTYATIRSQGERPVWINLVAEEDNIARAEELEQSPDAASLPLFGIPFAVKDNFDVAGMETTAACPDFARTAEQTAYVVDRLLKAGAILIGKTNMDQFATGLVGTRTPYGACSSVFDPDYISGGSSSGSAVAVASGLVSFSLGTDTAGSGRVPAAMNQLVGVKPTRGLLSTQGLLPACRTLDCVSIFAETCSDASLVLSVARGFDKDDVYSRTAKPGEGTTPWSASTLRFGIPTQESLEFFGDEYARANYLQAIATMQALGAEAVEFDYEQFRSCAELLYGGPWVAERLAAIKDFASEHCDKMDPTVSGIITSAQRFSAVDAFEAQYRLKTLARATDAVWDTVDILLLPTIPTTFTIEQVSADPVALNSKLGYYSNFVNLLDLAAIAIPSGTRPDGLPCGVTLVGKAFADDGLLAVADKLHRQLAITLGGSQGLLASTPALPAMATPPGCILMAVVGAHLRGQPLNWQMTDRKARLVRTTRTHASYRLYVLPNSKPAKPGLVYMPGFTGEGIELEIWAMPEDTVGSFLFGIPSPLSLGTIVLEDGSQVKGFLCEPVGIIDAEEITHFGGWIAYLNSQQ